MIFPDWLDRPHGEVNLDEEAARFRSEQPGLFEAGKNPLLDPAACQRMIDAMQRRLGIDWSWGGYLENRSNLWRGSYLGASGAFLHLGIDLNLPQGTRVAASFEARVILVDEDADHEGGWGTRVFLDARGLIFIYAHLESPSVAPGDRLKPGQIVAAIGGPPQNGNWHPHLHVQAMRAELFHELLLDRFSELDGYGLAAEQETLARDFPDPAPYLGLV